MKGFRSTVLALGIASGLSAVGPASADVVINGTFYEETKLQQACGAGNTCSLEMTPPTQKVLFTKLQCSVSILSSKTLYRLAFGVADVHDGINRRVEYLKIDQPSVALGLRWYAQSWETDFLFAPGKFPTITMNLDSSAAGSGLDCKLTGRIQQ